jgi:hypothetical protein
MAVTAILDSICIAASGEQRSIELWEGDLTEMPGSESVDVLVVSAFPNDYSPLPGTLIGALDEKGLSVAELAEDKAEDLRQNFSCWLSHPVDEGREVGVERILCFEPHHRGRPPEVVGDIFRSLAPFVAGPEAVRTVAMPLVSSGDAGEPIDTMLPPLVEAAVKWMSAGLPLRKLKIVERNREKAARLAQLFSQLKEACEDYSLPPTPPPAYDVFLSYCQKNAAPAAVFLGELRAAEPGLKVFQDVQELDTGAAWQQKIYEALGDCRRVVTMYTPDYLASKMCQEEYNLARIREREEGGVLFPVFLLDAQLPLHFKDIQYTDCREADEAKLRAASLKLVEGL